MKVGIIGAGTMGAGIAQVFLQAKFEVIIRDLDQVQLNSCNKNIEKNMQRLVDKDKISFEYKDLYLANLATTLKVEDLRDCDVVIEAAAERMDIKKKIFKELDEVCAEKTIFATNTSSLSISEIANVTNRREKVIGMHFFNPANRMKLVEIIKGQKTDEETYSFIEKISKAVGKTPIGVMESPGFAVNRILVPMINEAIFVCGEGVADAKDIDIAMKLGSNHPLGPLELADMIGLDILLAVMETLYEEFGDSKYRPAPLLRKMVRAGLLGRKTKEGFFKY